MERSFFVIVYDIPNDKRRLKLAKSLEALGERVQYSVFELYLTQPELERLLRRVRKLIHEDEDAVRVYDICAACRGKARSLGLGLVTPPPGLVVV